MFGFSSPPSARGTARSRSLSFTVVALALAGCDLLTHDAAAVDTPSTPPTLDATSPAAPAVLAYQDYWRTVENAARTANWRDPALQQVATGPALQAVRERLYTWHLAHRTAQGNVDTRPVVTSSAPRVVHLLDCIDSSHWMLTGPAGPLPTRTRTGRDRADVTVTFTGGRWRVAGLTFTRTPPC